MDHIDDRLSSFVIGLWEITHKTGYFTCCANTEPIIRGEPERAPNTRETGSSFICILYLYVCGVIISVRRESIYKF